MNFLFTLALLIFSSPHSGQDTIRISLFSLFKPETIHIRIASGESATLDATGLAGNQSVGRDETIRLRLSGGRLSIQIRGPADRTQLTSTATTALIVPKGRETFELTVPGRIKREVRGVVSVDTGTGGRGPLRIVLATDRESAVTAIVAAETDRRETEALKALGVVVRTYMLAHAGRHSSEGFDFCDTTHCQLYRGEQDLSDPVASRVVTDAVARTSGQVLRYEGRTVEGFYSAACGGISATPSMVWGGNSIYPYRRVICRWCRSSKFDKWERSADAAAVLNALSSIVSSTLSSAAQLMIDRDQPSGFVLGVTVRDGSKRFVLSTDAFRRAIGLRLGWNTVLSPTFTVERQGAKFIFRGRGFGSQIGLCEAGAVAQAASGRGYREILDFYYPGTELSERAAQ